MKASKCESHQNYPAFFFFKYIKVLAKNSASQIMIKKRNVLYTTSETLLTSCHHNGQNFSNFLNSPDILLMRPKSL